MKPRSIIFLTLGALVIIGLFLLFRPANLSQNTIPDGSTENQTPSSSNLTTLEITLKPDTVEPDPLSIKKGTKVVFKNEDSVARWPASDLHPTHEIYSDFDPKKPINPGESWEFIFEKVGNWKYHDHLNPAIRGEIVVVEGKVMVSPPVNQNSKVFNVIIKDKKMIGGNVFKARQGDTLEFNITGDEAEEFHVHGYDKFVDLVKDQPATLKFEANLSGRFEIELENSKTEIATLEVTPK